MANKTDELASTFTYDECRFDLASDGPSEKFCGGEMSLGWTRVAKHARWRGKNPIGFNFDEASDLVEYLNNHIND